MSEEISDQLIATATGLSSATLHEAAGRIGALPAVIKPLASGVKLCGRAFPVSTEAGDNLWLHRAIYAAAPGDVLVVEVSPGEEYGYWGEIMAFAAQQQGLAGLVIAGGVRDSQRLLEMRFAVFAATVCIRGTGKRLEAKGSIAEPVRIGAVTIGRGDLVLGDADGVVVIPRSQAAAAVEKSLQREAHEQQLLAQLRAGKRSIDIYEPAVKG